MPYFDAGATRNDATRTYSHRGAAGAQDIVVGPSSSAIGGSTSSRQKSLFFLLSSSFPSGREMGA